MIWRDDDVLDPAYGRLRDLLAVDDWLRANSQTHTVAILAKLLTPALAAVIRARHMVAQLHGWTHDSLLYTPSALLWLKHAVQKITDLIGVRPTVLYPPFNHSSARLVAVAADLGLTVCTSHHTLTSYLVGGGMLYGEPTINFHFWDPRERHQLRKALVIQARRTSAWAA